MVRCFVGVLLSGKVKTYILSLQREMEKLNLDCKFVEERNIHISISFIGEIDEQKVEEFKFSLKSIEDIRKFPVKTGEIKLIPSENFVRVVAVQVVDDSLDKLQNAIVNLVGGDAKPPHITLCRVRYPLTRQQIEVLKSLNIKEVEFVIDSVDLLKSTVMRHGPIYESIASYKLS